MRWQDLLEIDGPVAACQGQQTAAVTVGYEGRGYLAEGLHGDMSQFSLLVSA